MAEERFAKRWSLIKQLLVVMGIIAVTGFVLRSVVVYNTAYIQAYVTESQQTDACSCQGGGMRPMVFGEDYLNIVVTSETYYYIMPDGKKLWRKDVLTRCLHGRADNKAWNAVFGITD